ncbi:hypothetical protein BSPWISOXPB_9240 [uncultured Gammaproteobacteria bacterium]|nr:hypothetical protein BSPWISOXPB_9240 [uncultured Gammaproteobacteria bacterium]
MLSLRTAWAVTLALSDFAEPPVVGSSMVGSSMVGSSMVTVRVFFNYLIAPSGSDLNMIVIITAVFKVGGFKGKCSATQSEFILSVSLTIEKLTPFPLLDLSVITFSVFSGTETSGVVIINGTIFFASTTLIVKSLLVL